MSRICPDHPIEGRRGGFRAGSRSIERLSAHTNFCIVTTMGDIKPVRFVGGALDDLRAFPAPARREAGYQLDRVRHGQDPDEWKPMPAIGRGRGRFGFGALQARFG